MNETTATPGGTLVWRHRYADLGDLRLHFVEAGEGPLVVLLHGFPEFWYSWRYQLPALAAAGYRVVAPDMRGCNLSDKPAGVDAYRLSALTGDVARLIAACGAERATVIGHDWGANVAWAFAARYPEVLDRLVIMNAPHPLRIAEGWRTWRQLRKSWYVFAFQLPWLPEFLLRRFDYRALRTVFHRDPLRSGSFSEEDIDRYIEAIAQPRALTAAINYYRAALRRNPCAMLRQRQGLSRRIDAPTLVLWGEHDRYLGSELADPPAALVRHCRVVRFPDASHWVQIDAHERVNEELLAFLAEGRAGAPERAGGQ